MSDPLRLPSAKSTPAEVLARMKALRDQDARWQEGRTWSLVFYAGDELLQLLKDAYALFMSENGLNPSAFPSLRRFETEVIAMTAALLGGDGQVSGSMTTGGTESILMAVKTAREWARAHKPDIREPELVMPVSAHPAFDKAGHYFGVRCVHVPVGADFRADPATMAAAITPNTILLVGSAPSYPQGVIDPISEIAALAQSRGLLCHVDSCIGFILPFARAIGYPIPAYDFSVPGVTSLSVDLHKYAYAAKGASVILYRSRELRRHQFFVHTDWPGGIYASPTMTGTRAGGAIAAAWAVMNYLGEAGYREIAAVIMQTSQQLQAGIAAIPDLRILAEPAGPILAIGSDSLDIYAVGDEMAARGWHLDRQQNPASLHLTVSWSHAAIADKFLEDLAAAARQTRRLSWHKLSDRLKVNLVKGMTRLLPEKLTSQLIRSSAQGGVPKRTAAMYGMMGSLPNRGDVEELVLDFLDNLYALPDGDGRP